MIQQRAEALVALINRRRSVQKDLAVLDGYRNQAEAVTAATTQLTPLLTTWHLFARRAIGNTSAAPDVGSLIVDLDHLRGRFRSEPGYVLGPNRLTAVKSGVPAFADRFEQQLRAIWRGHVAARAPSVNAEVLQVLSTIGPLKVQVGRVAAGLRALNDHADRLPSTDAEVDAFETQARAVQTMWDAFDTDHLPPDVLHFLKDAGSNAGASIDALTDGVRAWLQSNGLAPSFRVRQTLN
jgi:hypothetical protein